MTKRPRLLAGIADLRRNDCWPRMWGGGQKLIRVGAVLVDLDGVGNELFLVRYWYDGTGAGQRRADAGIMSEGGIEDYLVLLSIRQTCRYRDFSFLKFLRSRQPDMDAFGRGECPKALAKIEVYPKTFVPPRTRSIPATT